MLAFVYYDPESNAVSLFRDWERAWTAGGWTPRILTRRMAMRDKRAKVSPASRLPWFALLACKPREDLFCESMACRPGNAVGVHEVPDWTYAEARC